MELKYVEFVSNNVIVHYDLLDSIEGRSYSVRLYSSSDGFLNAMEQVNGDAGLEVKSGKNKVINWIAKEELGSAFEGKVSLEVRAKLFVPFINTESINSYNVFKRDRKYNLTWSGGSAQNILNFDLMKGDKKIVSFPNLSNVGHHAFVFPAHVRPGKGYKFRISDTKNKDDVVYTKPFKIKRKVPLLVKAVPVILVGGVVFKLIQGNEEEDDLPRPIPVE